MKAGASYPKGAPRSLSERLAHLRDTTLCFIWLNRFEHLNLDPIQRWEELRKLG